MRTAWTLIGLLIAGLVNGQDPMGSEWIMQQLVENDQGGDAEELYANVTRHIEQPVDLNNCSRTELEKTGIFTPFQVFAIMDQRERYGPFFSIYELAAIPGITREFLEEIRQMITFTEEDQPVTRQHIDGMLLTNVAYRSPPASGFLIEKGEQAPYQGEPLKFTHRIRISHGDQLSLGAAFEKDPGEKWFNRKRPEHFTGYLAYTPGNFIEQLVVGNFRIHRGMGLVHRLGFSSRSTANALNGYRRSYGKPFASTLEYDYFRGVYGSASKGKWELDMFLSQTPADISFFRLEEKENLFDMTRLTGLHRTSGESRGFDLARTSSAGASINRSGRNFYAGCSFTGAHMQLTQLGIDSLKIVDPMKILDSVKPPGSLNGSVSVNGSDSVIHADVMKFSDPLKSSRAAVSVYAVAFGTNYEVFGEIACNGRFHAAALFGGSLVVNPALSAEASFRRLSPGYRGVMPGTEDGADDEYELGLAIRITPFRYGRLSLYHDLKVAGRDARFTDPVFPGRYNSIECYWGTPGGPAITFRYTGKTTREINAGTRTGAGTLTNQYSHHFRIHYSWAPAETLVLQGRAEVSTCSEVDFDGLVGAGDPATVTGGIHETGKEEGAEAEPGPGSGCLSNAGSVPFHNTGSMVYQQLQWIPRERVRVTYRYLLFDVGDWKNRIYSYEPGVKYSFLFPSWVGKGSRNVVVLSAKIGRRITLRGKYGLTVYAHKWETGTGSEIRNGNRLTDFELQLQIDLY